MHFLARDCTAHDIDGLTRHIGRHRAPRDITIVSVHWGGNWGLEIPELRRTLAHALIDHAGVAIVHGHSSHHVKAIEVHHGRLVLYGGGDLLNDYEGLTGYESFRGDLGLMYFVTLDAATGALVRLSMVPTRVRGFRIRLAEAGDAAWLRTTMERECRRFGGQVTSEADGALALQWKRKACAKCAASGPGSWLRDLRRGRLADRHAQAVQWPGGIPADRARTGSSLPIACCLCRQPGHGVESQWCSGQWICHPGHGTTAAGGQRGGSPEAPARWALT